MKLGCWKLKERGDTTSCEVSTEEVYVSNTLIVSSEGKIRGEKSPV